MEILKMVVMLVGGILIPVTCWMTMMYVMMEE